MIRPFATLFGLLVLLGTVGGSARAAASGKEVPYIVSIGGRPLDAIHPGARERGGRLFINVVRAVRAFNGLLTFSPSATSVTIGGHSFVYHAGKTTAEQDDETVTLISAPFMEDGDMFVPLTSFADFVSASVTVNRNAHRVDLTPSDSHT